MGDTSQLNEHKRHADILSVLNFVPVKSAKK